MAFESLTDKLQNVFKNLRSKGRLTEADVKEAMKAFIDKEETVQDVWAIGAQVTGLANNAEDYASMYHNVDGKMVRHDQVHNLFGYIMTRAAGEGLREISPDKRCLLFSRSSYIGMHPYSGIWPADNKSWWSHILLNLKMLPSLNMCGFLYTGADLGGFGCNTTRDLLLRWLVPVKQVDRITTWLSLSTVVFRSVRTFFKAESGFCSMAKKSLRTVTSWKEKLFIICRSSYLKAEMIW